MLAFLFQSFTSTDVEEEDNSENNNNNENHRRSHINGELLAENDDDDDDDDTDVSLYDSDFVKVRLNIVMTIKNFIYFSKLMSVRIIKQILTHNPNSTYQMNITIIEKVYKSLSHVFIIYIF